jgi:hypothetical protein
MKDFVRIRRTVKYWFKRLTGLAKGWDIFYDIGSIDNPEWQADVSYNDGERKAWITLDPAKIKENDLPETIAHELAHVLLRDLDMMIYRVIETSVAPSDQHLVQTIAKDRLERACDDIARVTVVLVKDKDMNIAPNIKTQ